MLASLPSVHVPVRINQLAHCPAMVREQLPAVSQARPSGRHSSLGCRRRKAAPAAWGTDKGRMQVNCTLHPAKNEGAGKTCGGSSARGHAPPLVGRVLQALHCLVVVVVALVPAVLIMIARRRYHCKPAGPGCRQRFFVAALHIRSPFVGQCILSQSLVKCWSRLSMPRGT